MIVKQSEKIFDPTWKHNFLPAEKVKEHLRPMRSSEKDADRDRTKTQPSAMVVFEREDFQKLECNL